ncbi:MAG: hypothetical protein WBW41_12935 [Verrucomicrobiia bacterium]
MEVNIQLNAEMAAGTLTAFCVAQKALPREVRNQAGLLKDFQKLLRHDGVPLAWPKGVRPV